MRFKPKIYGDEHEAGNSTVHESRVANKLNGHRQAGSGSSIYAKGDIKLDNFLIECKTTQNKSISIKKGWLSKITKEALAVQKDPALSFEIGGDSDPVTENDWIAIPMSVFERLIGE